MKKDLLLLLQVVLVILLLSCSESNKVTGGSIEDQNAISVEQINEWYGYGTGLQESAYARIDGGKLAVAEDGSGARAECTADSSTLAMTIQIFESYAVSTLQGSGIVNSCDSSFSVFKISCLEKSKGQFFSISEGCKEGNFDAACRLNQVESDSISMLITHFSNVAADRCAEMAKNAQSSTGKVETASSSSKSNDVSSSSTAADDPVDCENCNTSNPGNQDISIDSNKTLKNYVLQYTLNESELSFDERVIAYNGSLSKNCEDYISQTTGISVTTLFSKSPMFIGDDEAQSLCFPMTNKIKKEHSIESKDACRYFITLANDGMQPTGHVLVKIADRGLELTSISPGGTCTRSNMFNSVAFLIEDCKNEIEPGEFEGTFKTFNSEIWKCKEGSYSPTPDILVYGEWFNANLLLKE